jgi:hypothetical protein
MTTDSSATPVAARVGQTRPMLTVLHTWSAKPSLEVSADERHFATAVVQGGDGHRACGVIELSFKGVSMYWVMVAIMAGIGFGYVVVRRRRKAEAAKAA